MKWILCQWKIACKPCWQKEKECDGMNIQRILRSIKDSLKRIVTPFNRKMRGVFSQIRERRISINGQKDDYGYLEDKSFRDKIRKIRINIDSKVFYMVFIIVASLFCILVSQISPDSRFRTWYQRIKNEPVISKGIQLTDNKGITEQENGTFLTYYRFQGFGATDPNDIDPNAPMIALTFDDGPNPASTQRILDILNANYSHATFLWWEQMQKIIRIR